MQRGIEKPLEDGLVCCTKGCHNRVSCADPKCKKFMHVTCYQGMCMQRGIEKPLEDGLVCCTKGCHNRVLKQKQNKQGKLNWQNDGKCGPVNPHTSMRIVLDWYHFEGNYSKWRGKNNNEEKRMLFIGNWQTK